MGAQTCRVVHRLTFHKSYTIASMLMHHTSNRQLGHVAAHSQPTLVNLRPHLIASPRRLPSTRSVAAIPAITTTRVTRRRRLEAQAVQFEGPIPPGVQVEIKPEGEGPEVEFDEGSKTLRLPINVVEGSSERRTKLVIFTCNKCGGRTARNVNPIAWDKGMVMGQCATCEAWHVLSAKNKAIYEEIRYKDDPRYNGQGEMAGDGKGDASPAA